MTAGTVTQAATIPRIHHEEAMTITAEENRRLGDLLVAIKPDQWSLPTDCTRWDVRAIVVHLIAGPEAAGIGHRVRSSGSGRIAADQTNRRDLPR